MIHAKNVYLVNLKLKLNYVTCEKYLIKRISLVILCLLLIAFLLVATTIIQDIDQNKKKILPNKDNSNEIKK